MAPTLRQRRESTDEKAVRLLATGKLRITWLDPDLIVAECIGDSGGVYVLGWSDQRWSCSCPARTDCSHLRALWRVTVKNHSAAEYHAEVRRLKDELGKVRDATDHS